MKMAVNIILGICIVLFWVESVISGPILNYPSFQMEIAILIGVIGFVFLYFYRKKLKRKKLQMGIYLLAFCVFGSGALMLIVDYFILQNVFSESCKNTVEKINIVDISKGKRTKVYITFKYRGKTESIIAVNKIEADNVLKNGAENYSIVLEGCNCAFDAFYMTNYKLVKND